jgi:hypothetical protein
MTQTMEPTATVIYKFSRGTGQYTCPICKASFQTTFGLWPYLEGTDTPVCRGVHPDLEDADDVTPCDTLFTIPGLSADTRQAIASADTGLPVAERLRRAGLDEALPNDDRVILCRASIDLAYCEADSTRIEATEPELVLQTCGVAAAEMLLSGIGDVV